MSKSQIKRLHQQQELEKAANLNEEEEKEEAEPAQRKGPANRFAFFDDEEEQEDSGDPSAASDEEEKPKVISQKAAKNRAKKNKKKAAKKQAEEETENQMLARLAALNAKEAKKTTSEAPTLEELMKIDRKMFDMSAEIKRKLGKAFKEVVVTPGQPDENRWPVGKRAIGRIVKNKPRWFPDRDYGVTMVQTSEEGGNTWYTLRHNRSYEDRERMFWLAESSMNVSVIHEIFADTPYHLNTLLLMAHMNRMNEELNSAADLIERGIWYVDQHATPTFEPFHWRHRMDYRDYENRSFFLLLHRHMLNASAKRCYETAWNTSKMIFKLDPVKDPLAIMSIMDVYALKAKQYQWIINVFEAAKKFKKLHLLPNWPYSVALSKFFLAQSDEEKDQAEAELCQAIRHFPSVVVQLMDILQIHPDSAVMNCKMLTTFVADNERDSLKLLMKIYAKETAEIWKIPENLLFLEGATRKVATSKDAKEIAECEEWREKRNKMYQSRSPNVDRFAQLLEELPSESITNPIPPQNGRCAYSNDNSSFASRIMANDSFLGGFITSLIPHFEEGETLDQHFARYGRQFMEFLGDRANHIYETMPEMVARWMQIRTEIDEEEEAREAMIRVDGEAPIELPEGGEGVEEESENDEEA